MKRSKLSVFGLLLLALMLVLVGCVKPEVPTPTPTPNPGDTPGDGSGNGGQPGDDQKEPVTTPVYADGTELRFAVAHNNSATTITFMDATKLNEGQITLADGQVYTENSLKPVWAEVQKNLKITVKNVYTGTGDVNAQYENWAKDNFAGVDILCGNVSAIAPDGRAGKLVDLSKYLDKMPNFKRFLEENPIVYLSVLGDTANGSIYYSPYFDGFDDIEKYFLMRHDWVKILLDGAGEFNPAQSDAWGKSTVYTPYMPTTGTVTVDGLDQDGANVIEITKDYTTSYGNIVAYMNANVTATTTGAEMVNMLRGYIDAAYAGRYGNERSRLFIGNDAAWDADELVALLRCVVTNTYALTGKAEPKVTGIFPRENTLQRTQDFLNLASMFGYRGYESRNGYLYFDNAGNLVDARGDEAAAAAAIRMNAMKQEGLIQSDFYSTSDKKPVETHMKNNTGFMLYDYLQTQTVYNEQSAYAATREAAAALGHEFKFTAAMNPVASWNDGTGAKYMRFTESWRSVKTGGWCIPVHVESDTNKLNAALAMFDYPFSEEGSILMSYGPAAWRSGNTISYKGEQVPELSEAALTELDTLASGNYTNYARQYLGSTLPIGFVKDQGMEYQCTTAAGREGGAIVSNAIAKGTIKHVVPTIESNLWYTMVPTVLPTTEQQDAQIKLWSALGNDGLYSKSKGKYNMFVHLISEGCGATIENQAIAAIPADAASIAAVFAANHGAEYVAYQQAAWNALKSYYLANLA